MTLRDDLKAKTITAMKEKNEGRLMILRSMSAALKDADIAARTKGNQDGIDEKEIMALFQSMIKKRNDSIEMYKQGGRQDLADKEQAQIAVLEEFLPKQLSEADMEKVIKETITKIGAASVKDMGKIMATLKENYTGQMDFSKASNIIKAALA